MNSKIYIILIVLSSLSTASFSQDEERIPKIRIIGRAYQDSIKLRWAPDDPATWYYLNQHGYILERVTLMRDGDILSTPERTFLTEKPLKPYAMELWEAETEINDYAAVAAQAIFGESFEVETNVQVDEITRVINKARELESRHSFALFSADMSTKVAKLSGLLFTDKNIKKNEKYLYLVYSAIPKEIQLVDTGYVYLSTDDFQPLPKPIDLTAEFGDGFSILTWNQEYLASIYNAYKVERSDDGGKTFFELDSVPLVNTVRDPFAGQRVMIKIDSLPQNNKEYFYRVKGLNAFGETGPPSDTISGMGKKELFINPKITETKVFNNSVQVNWQYPDTLNRYIKGFRVQRSTSDKGPFTSVHDSVISPDQRIYVDLEVFTSIYYKVVVEDLEGNQKSTFPHYIQLIDSIPPEPPVGVVGIIDTLGIVTLHWKSNTEEDLFGYRVYRSNFRNSEFGQITKTALRDSIFIDTINIKTLTKKIYYKVVAVDGHFNQSGFSGIFELKRPDLIPPVPPVFTSYESNGQGIKLAWINSSSDDVVKQLLYRKAENEEGWKLMQIFNMPDTIDTFIDTETDQGKLYQYTMLAVDDSKNESKPIKPVSVKQFESKIVPSVEKIKYNINREEKYIRLSWEYSNGIVDRYLIYRAENNEQPSFYSSVNGGTTEFTDKKLNINSQYSYHVKVVLFNGKQSLFSEKIIVKF